MGKIKCVVVCLCVCVREIREEMLFLYRSAGCGTEERSLVFDLSVFVQYCGCVHAVCAHVFVRD